MRRFFTRFGIKGDQTRPRQDALAGSPATYIGNNRILTRIDIGGRRLVFYVEADDKLITPTFVTNGAYDVASTNYFLTELATDSHCVDVGANFGYFTCLMARLTPKGRVIGIEADERIAALLRDNILINGLHEVAQSWHAAANATGEPMRLFRRSKRSGNTSIISYGAEFTDFMLEPEEEEFTVAGLRVDEILPGFGGRIDFLKIDVEGAEPLAFDGARETIATNPQIRVIMEWSPGQILKAGFEISLFLENIRAAGLRAHTLEDGPTLVSFDEMLNLPYQAGLLLSRDAA